MKGFKRYCAAALMGLMVFSAVPGVSAAEKIIVTDMCDDFENAVIEKVNNVEVASVEVKWTSDITETDTMWRKMDPTTTTANPDKPSYVIFHTDEDMSGFHVETFFCKRDNKLAKDLSFQVSADGVDYTGISATSVERTVPTVESGGQSFSENGWSNFLWRQVNYDYDFLPEGTKYLKIQFGNTNDVKFHDVAVSKVEILTIEGSDTRYLEQAAGEAKALLDAEKDNVGDGDGQYPQTAYDALQEAYDAAQALLEQQPEAGQDAIDEAKDTLLAAIETFRQSRKPLAYFIDDCNDLEVPESTKNLKPVDNDSTGLGDTTRFVRAADGDAEVVYQVDEAIQFIEVEAAYTRNAAEVAANDMAGDMEIWVSANGSDFGEAPLQAVRSIDGAYFDTWKADSWYRVRFTAFDVPEDTRYVKIVFGDQTAMGKNYANQLQKVTLDNKKHGSSISGMSVWEVVDGSGIRVDEARLKEGGNFKITGNLTIDPTASESAMLVAAVMDGDKLRGVSIHETADSGRFDFADGSVVVPAGLENPNIRVFMWDGTALQPLAAAQYLF